jgi:hypothetical protein
MTVMEVIGRLNTAPRHAQRIGFRSNRLRMTPMLLNPMTRTVARFVSGGRNPTR